VEKSHYKNVSDKTFAGGFQNSVIWVFFLDSIALQGETKLSEKMLELIIGGCAKRFQNSW